MYMTRPAAPKAYLPFLFRIIIDTPPESDINLIGVDRARDNDTVCENNHLISTELFRGIPKVFYGR